MGLDIYHLKSTLSPKIRVIDQNKYKMASYVVLDELQNPEKFSAYVNNELLESFISKVALFETKEDLLLLKDLLENSKVLHDDYGLFLVGDERQNGEEILEFEVSQNLEPNTRSIHEDHLELQEKRIHFKTIVYECKIYQNIIYTEEVGYQRKGMNKDFYKSFLNDYYYTEKEAFEKLLNYTDPTNHMFNPENIKKEFIDTYEEDKSILYISW